MRCLWLIVFLTFYTASCFAEGTATIQTDLPALRAKAQQGDATAQNKLGDFLFAHGKGTQQDLTEAAEWYRKAAVQGYPAAQSSLGYLYDAGDGVEKDEAQAAKWWGKAAEQGDSTAEFFLGLAYASGQGVEKDDAQAVKWLQKAADQGHSSAQFQLTRIKAHPPDDRSQADPKPISQQTSEAYPKSFNSSQPHLTNDLASIIALAVMGLVLFFAWPKQRSKAAATPVLASRARPAALATVTEDEFKDYAGTNAYKFFRARAKALEGKFVSLAWAPVLLGPVWAGYYKSWSGVWPYIGMQIGCMLLTDAMGLKADSIFYTMIFWLTWIVMGATLPVRYVIQASKKIAKFKAAESNPSRLNKILENEGGTSKFAALMTLLIYGSYIALIVSLFPAFFAFGG